MVGHTCFYASMLTWIWLSLEFCYENKTSRSDPTKGGLSMGNVLEVDLEMKSQRAQHILTSQVENGGNCSSAIGTNIQAPADSVSCKGQK